VAVVAAAAGAAAAGAAEAGPARLRITVFAGSSRHSAPAYTAVAAGLGRAIAARGHDLVYGGGRTGLMGAVADGALEAGGRVHGVILRRFIEEDVHHLGVEMFEVDDMRARKAGLDERADAFVALPGGLGTLEELAEALSFRKLALHHRPVVLLNPDGFWDPLLGWFERAIADGFEKAGARDWWAVARAPEEAVSLCETLRARPI
jgi:uncharacterized protein (TIGR00730 family)